MSMKHIIKLSNQLEQEEPVQSNTALSKEEKVGKEIKFVFETWRQLKLKTESFRLIEQ